MILIKLLGLILLVILIVIAIIIIIPYAYCIKGSNIANPNIEFSLIWLFGKIKITFVINYKNKKEFIFNFFRFSKTFNFNDKDESKHVKKENIKSKKKEKKRGFISFIDREIINKILQLIEKLLRNIKPKYIFLDAKIGFNNPMYTGFAYALCSQYSYMIKDNNIQIQPTFEEEVFKGRFSIDGRIWIIYILGILLEFLFSAPVKKVIVSMIRKKKGGAI